RAFSDHLRDHKVGNQLYLALLQRGRRVRHASLVQFQVGLALAVASTVAAVSILVEGGHLRVEAPALDGQYQTGAVELGLTQVGAVGHLAIGLPAVTRPAMTR